MAENSTDVTAIYQQGQLQFGGGVEKGKLDENIIMFLEDPIEEEIKYQLENRVIYNLRNEDMNCYYDENGAWKGILLFSEIDRSDFIISGTFEFSTVTDQCDTINVTDGRFDLKYIP